MTPFFFPSRSRECMNESRLRPIAARFLWKVCFCFHRHSMTLHKRAFKFYSPKHSLIDLGKRGYICPSEIANHSIWHTDAVLYCFFFGLMLISQVIPSSTVSSLTHAPQNCNGLSLYIFTSYSFPALFLSSVLHFVLMETSGHVRVVY